MKILLISERFYPQVVGSGTSAYLIAKELVNKGHEVTVATDIAIKSLLGTEKLPFSMYYVNSFEEYILGKASFQKPMTDLYRLLIKEHFDVVQVNNLMPMLLISLLKPYVHAPVIFTIHNTPNGNQRAIGYFGDSPLDISLAKSIVKLKAYEFIVNGSECYEKFAIRLGGNKKIMKTSYFGVDQKKLLADLETFKDVDINQYFNTPISKDTMLITLPARITQNKGIIDAIEAFSYFPKELNAKLLLTNMSNPFNQKYADEVIQRAVELSIQKKILIPNKVIPRNILPIIYQRSNIVITPSHYEGLGLSTIEALVIGRPLIATDAPGLNEIVINEYNGLLVPINDPVSLSKALKRLISDKSLSETISSNARASVTKFDIRQHVSALENIYIQQVGAWQKH